MTNENNMKKANTKGITLIALVVTIVILLILAGITINYVFSEGGLFDTAKNSGNTWQNAQNSDINALNDLNGIIGNLVNGIGSGGTTDPDTPTPDDPTPPTPEEPKGPNNKPLVTNGSLKANAAAQNMDVEDEYGNKVIIPKGFKIAADSGTTVPEGIVIEDMASTEAEGTEGEEGYKPATTGNQFVWIPVGKVYKSASEADFVEVQLGRYTFNTTTGAPEPKQLAFNNDGTANYETEVGIRPSQWDGWGYPADAVVKELSTERPGVASGGTDGTNATAKDLAGFLTSARDNGGYYIARYEASYGSGFDISKNKETTSNKYSLACYENAKPLSKKSIKTSFTTSTENPLTEGSLWNYITELAASKVSRNMYAGNKDAKGNSVGVESDLMNSYAFDTAIVYIRQMKEEYANFANFKYNTTVNGNTVGSSTRKDTGATDDKDKFCNIYDMVANCFEWTTEYSTYSDSSRAYPCGSRGGRYGGTDGFTASRYNNAATTSYDDIAFRPLCYVK